MPRALLATGNTHPDKGQAGVLQRIETAHRVAEIGVARIDHDVALSEMGFQRLHLLIDRVAGFDHDDDRTRRADRGDEFLNRFAGDDLILQSAGLRVKSARRINRAVENGDLVAFFSNVERQVRAHDSETD